VAAQNAWYVVSYVAQLLDGSLAVGRNDVKMTPPASMSEVDELDRVLTDSLVERGKIGKGQIATVLGWTLLG
jgi:hypothetical protein